MSTNYIESKKFSKTDFNAEPLPKGEYENCNFVDCALQEVDFTEADLSGRSFDNCDLTDAIFDNCNLEKSDFRAAYNYTIDPELNRMKKARFSMPGVAGLLGKYGIEID
jgi:uncharacterized protein YjbI with pentapeptide repeats